MGVKIKEKVKDSGVTRRPDAADKWARDSFLTTHRRPFCNNRDSSYLRGRSHLFDTCY
jgi:hypothetical protein